MVIICFFFDIFRGHLFVKVYLNFVFDIGVKALLLKRSQKIFLGLLRFSDQVLILDLDSDCSWT